MENIKITELSNVSSTASTDLILLSTNTASSATSRSITVNDLQSNIGVLSNDLTVTVSTGLTTAQIQTLINNTPHNLNGYNITFQFGAETHVLSQSLSFVGFVGGALLIRGADTTADLNTSQTTIFDGSALATRGILIANCPLVHIFNLKVLFDSTASFIPALDISAATVNISFCWFVGEAGGSNDGRGIFMQQSNAFVYKNYFTAGNYGIYAYNCSDCFARENDDTGTQPKVGIYSRASIVYLQDNAITGSTIDTDSINGGQIFS